MPPGGDSDTRDARRRTGPDETAAHAAPVWALWRGCGSYVTLWLEDYPLSDRGSTGDRPDEARWDELWQLGNSLVFDPESTPITIVDGKLVERDLDGFTAATRIRVIAAKRRGMEPQSGRLHDLVAALGGVSQRRR